jgi:cytidine deaminase
MKGEIFLIEFNQIYSAAMEVINSVAASRGFIEPNTTVCVIYTRSGRLFNGVSVNDVHAEIEAVRNMQSFGENAVDSIILVDASSRVAMLPCFNCISMIISMNPMNNSAVVSMPDRAVSFQEVLSQNPLGYNPVPQPRGLRNSMPASSVVITGRSNGDLLNSKLSSLMAASNQEESDEDKELLEELEGETKGKRGFFGSLFGKK